MKKKNAINLLSFIEEYYLQEKPLLCLILYFIIYIAYIFLHVPFLYILMQKFTDIATLFVHG